MQSRLSVKYWLITILLCGYLFFGLAYLGLPGLEYDEVLFANAAMGNVDGTFIQWEIKVAGKHLPMMLMGYVGALKAYLYAPIFAVFGASVTATRLPVILMGLASLLVIYKFASEFLGIECSLVALALLALDPTYIFMHRLDWGPVALTMLLKTSALYLLWRWMAEGRLYLLGVGAFLLGLGLFDKLIFAWFIVALVMALCLCWWQTIRARLNLRTIMVCAACFLLGCWPLIAFNIKYPLRTFRGQEIVTPSFKEALVYRYGLFRWTLDGSAVIHYVNDLDTIGPTEATGREQTGVISKIVLSVLRPIPLEGDFIPQALILALAFLLILWRLGRLRAKDRIAFLLLQVVLVGAFICATAQATGPHHAIMVQPFTHLLIAFAVCEFVRLCRGIAVTRFIKMEWVAAFSCFVLLVLPPIDLDAGYLRSFLSWGGVGKWSDAIYALADFAGRSDKSFRLMDWGFSNQLLLLSGGRIRKEETFVPVFDLPSDELKIEAMGPYLTDTQSLFVFHAPGSESFPLLGVFKRALERYDLEAFPVKTFYQGNGQPVYLVYRIAPATSPAERNTVGGGHGYYFREAEDWDTGSGGALDFKPAASRMRALGEYWGRNLSDFAAYRFTVPARVATGYLSLRYAFEGSEPNQLNVLLDDNLVDVMTLDATGGFGYQPDEWNVATTKLGALEPGAHEIRFMPAHSSQVINIDYLCIADYELWPGNERPATLSWRHGSSGPPGMVLLGYLDRPQVRIEISPSEVVAGKDSLRIHTVNFEASAIDVLYTVDRKKMPPIYDWRLDRNHTSTVSIGRDSPKGIYHYQAIRDSAEASPAQWIPVDVSVRVR